MNNKIGLYGSQRSLKSHLQKQNRQGLQALGIGLAICLSILLIIYLLAIRFNLAPNILTKEPLSMTKMPWYAGLISVLGVLLWSTSGGCAVLGAVLKRNNPRKFWWLLATGILSFFLSIDDFYMLHEVVIPRYMHVPELYVYVLYMGIGAAYFLLFLKDILADSSLLILGAAFFFLLSPLVMHQLLPYSGIEAFIVDCLKFTGICMWMLFVFTTTVNLVEIKQLQNFGI